MLSHSKVTVLDGKLSVPEIPSSGDQGNDVTENSKGLAPVERGFVELAKSLTEQVSLNRLPHLNLVSSLAIL